MLSGSCVRGSDDNQGGIALAVNPVSSAPSKHDDLCFHFVRELLRAKHIDIQYVASEQQHVDILRKSRSCDSFYISPYVFYINRWRVSKGHERYSVRAIFESCEGNKVRPPPRPP